MEYTKQPITLVEQIDILKQRGLIIENENEALSVLNRISYFRLASYKYKKIVYAPQRDYNKKC